MASKLWRTTSWRIQQAQGVHLFYSKRCDINKQLMYPLLVDADAGKRFEVGRITFTNNKLKQYFPKSFTPRQMEETIFKLLEQWQQKRERDIER